jgi:hypothetical protein
MRWWVGLALTPVGCFAVYRFALFSFHWIGLEHLQLQHLKERPYFHFRGWFLDFEGQFFSGLQQNYQKQAMYFLLLGETRVSTKDDNRENQLNPDRERGDEEMDTGLTPRYLSQRADPLYLSTNGSTAFLGSPSTVSCGSDLPGLKNLSR